MSLGPSSPLPAGVASLLYSAMSPASHSISHSAATKNHWLCGLLLSGRPWGEHLPGSVCMFLALQSVPDISCIVASLDAFISTARQPPGKAAKLLKVALRAILLWDNTLDHSLFLASHWLIEDISSPCGSAIQRLPFCVFAGMRDHSI